LRRMNLQKTTKDIISDSSFFNSCFILKTNLSRQESFLFCIFKAMNKSLFIVFLFSLFVFSCKKEETEAPEGIDLGTAYYPTDIGKYVIYDVDSIIYNDFNKDTLTFKYRIKEKFTETYTDNLGLPAIRLERYIKKYNPTISYDSLPWSIKEVWSVNNDLSTVQVVESNLRFTKLIFPVQANSSWNGNAFNSLGQQVYYYKYIDNTETIGPLSLTTVLSVQQKEVRTLINYQNYVEKYAKGIGLVYREITDLQSNTIVSNVAVEDRIEKGITYKQTILSYGIE
jgi:hypothetical protein